MATKSKVKLPQTKAPKTAEKVDKINAALEKSKLSLPEIKKIKKAMKTVPMSAIKPWRDNPRMISETSTRHLAQILAAHGQVAPLTVRKETGEILAGNARYAALKLLKATTVDIIEMSFTDDAAATAYALADNKASELNSWNPELLAKLMKSDNLEKTYTTALPDVTGFTEKELVKLMQVKAPVHVDASKSAKTGTVQEILPLVTESASADSGITIAKRTFELIVTFDSQKTLDAFKENVLKVDAGVQSVSFSSVFQAFEKQFTK